MNALYELILPFRFYKTLRRCDVFKTNQNSGSIAASIAKIILPRKKFIARSGYIGSEMGSQNLSIFIRIYYYIAENLTYRICNKALISGSQSYHTLLRKYPFLQEKLILHNNFINTEVFKKSTLTQKIDIIYVARLDLTQKNHLAIINACKNTPYKVLFIGQGKDEALIARTAKENNVELTIIPKVQNNELSLYYNESRICVFPSHYEGNPKSLLEAMACELPIIAYRNPGIENIIIKRMALFLMILVLEIAL